MGQARIQRVRRIYRRVDTSGCCRSRSSRSAECSSPRTSLTRSVPHAAWMPENKWCVSLISAALVGGLGWACVRGLSLGKWVPQHWRICDVHCYASLILLPLLGPRARPIEKLSAASIRVARDVALYCFNIFSKLAVGALRDLNTWRFWPRETRAPARDGIGRSRSHRFACDRVGFYSWYQFGARVRWQQPDRPNWSGAANVATRAKFLSHRGRHRVDRNSVNDHANDCFDQRSRYRQLAITNGGGAGIGCCRIGFRICIRDTKRRSIPSSSFGATTLLIAIASQIGAGIQEAFHNSSSITPAKCFLYGIVYFHDVREYRFWRGARFVRELRSGCALRRSAVLPVALSAIFFHHLPDYRRAEPA